MNQNPQKALKWLWMIPIQLFLDFLYVVPGAFILTDIHEKYVLPEDALGHDVGILFMIVLMEIPCLTIAAVIFSAAAAVMGYFVLKGKSADTAENDPWQTPAKKMDANGAWIGILIFFVLEIVLFIGFNLAVIFA